MSRLRDRDDSMHYSDGSHRWTAPPGVDQDGWAGRVRTHIAEHLGRPDITLGGGTLPAPVDGLASNGPTTANREQALRRLATRRHQMRRPL